MVAVRQLVSYLEELLLSKSNNSFKDYVPNGWQVEGKPEVLRLATSVTASLDCIEQAAIWGADALLVHHGWFWKNEPVCVRGMKYRRMKALLNADINLLAYHLPLDAHPVFGNNIQLAAQLGIESAAPIAKDNLIYQGTLPVPLSVEAFSSRLSHALGQAPCVITAGSDASPSTTQPICRVAWCTGAAQDGIIEAFEAGNDAYVTGEVSERTTHLARELGIHFFAAGHHATERYGVQALGAHLASHFGIEQYYIEIDNPV